jgi:hypothetical protein
MSISILIKKCVVCIYANFQNNVYKKIGWHYFKKMCTALLDDRTPLVDAILKGDGDAARAIVARDPSELAQMCTLTFFPIRKHTGDTCGDYGGVTKKGNPCKRSTYLRGGMLEAVSSKIGIIDTLEWAMAQVEWRMCNHHLHGKAAVQWRQDIITVALLDKPAALVRNRTWRQMTPLMCAMWQHDWPLARWLLGATPSNYIDIRTENGLTAVHVAALTGNDAMLREVMQQSPGISPYGIFSARVPRTCVRHPLIMCVLEGLDTAVKTTIDVMVQKGALGCESWPVSVKRCALQVYELLPALSGNYTAFAVRGWLFRDQRDPTVRSLHLVDVAGISRDFVFSGVVPPIPHIGWHGELSCCGVYTVTDQEGVAHACGRCNTGCKWTVRVSDAPENGTYFVGCSASGILLSMDGEQKQHAVHSNFLRHVKVHTARPHRELIVDPRHYNRLGTAWCAMMQTDAFPMGGVLSGCILKALTVDQFQWVLHDRMSRPHVCRYLRCIILNGPANASERGKLSAAITCPSFSMCHPYGGWPNMSTLLDTLYHRMKRDALHNGNTWAVSFYRMAVLYSALQGHRNVGIDWNAAVEQLDCPVDLTVLGTYPNDGKHISVGRQQFKARPLFDRAFRSVSYGPSSTTPSRWLTAWFKTVRWTLLLASAREGPLPQLPEDIVLHIMSFVQKWSVVHDRIVLR